MKVTIKTSVLQEMVGKAVRGASNNKMLPLTSLMAVQVEGDTLETITTDATNYLYLNSTLPEKQEDFYVVVEVEKFSKLVSRMTSENITLEVLEDKLQITGNGKYSIELQLDEEGNALKYPDPLMSLTFDTKPVKIKTETVKAILNTCKPALAVTMEVPCYTGYYVGDKVVATDTYKICGMDTKVLKKAKLVSPEVMNLLDLVTEEVIELFIVDNKMVFRTTDCTVYSVEMEGIEDYAIDAITGLLNEEFESMCKVSKVELLSMLDRLSLFVGAYDKNAVNLVFSDKELLVSSKASSGVESIKYTESENPKEFACTIDIDMLATQIKAQTGEVLEVWYGLDNAIKLVDGNTKSIIALLEQTE